MKFYKKNLKKLIEGKAYDPSHEHDACGVGFVASTEGKKSRKIVEYGIKALKALWHRGAIDADGKSGDGAGIHIEIPKDFFVERIQNAGRQHEEGTICVGMIFLPRNDYVSQEKCKTIVENELLKKIIMYIDGDKFQLILKFLELKQRAIGQKLSKLFLNQTIII